jgi:hypothetical protein
MGKTGLADYHYQTLHFICCPENIFLSQFPENEF